MDEWIKELRNELMDEGMNEWISAIYIAQDCKSFICIKVAQ